MKFFYIKYIVPPGRVHFKKHGLVELFSINDEFAEILWKEKCRYIQLTAEGRYKFYNQEPITMHAIPSKKKKV